MRYEQDIEQQILADNQRRSNEFLRDFMNRHRGDLLTQVHDDLDLSDGAPAPQNEAGSAR